MTYNPRCKKCGEHHLNFDPCPKPIRMGEGVGRFRSPDGFHTMQGWGARTNGGGFGNTRGVPIVYQMPPLRTHGSLTGADGEPYTP